MADRLLALVPHEHTHAPRSILEQARKLGPDVTEMRAIGHTMEHIAHSLGIANGAPAKVAQEGWPGKTASVQRPACWHKLPRLLQQRARCLEHHDQCQDDAWKYWICT